ncbi:MAG: low molecular weight phosphotyrosine protein phosphatase [Acidobacteria bacterium]|nr:low molecular weight phosphotyrosine protein phosphatase [Acidobacteriota bacterium]
MIRVLFVCMGNICRSPAAEGVFRHLVAEAGADDAWEIDSAGTIGYHSGELADARMRAAASRRGYELTSRARRVQPDDFERFDRILAMDRENLDELEAMAPADSHARIELFGRWVQRDAPPEVPDPYYGGAQGFEHVLDLLEVGCRKLLAEAAEGASA